MASDNKPTRRDLLKLAAGLPVALAALSQAANNHDDPGDKSPKPLLLKDRPANSHRILTCNILLDLKEHTGNINWKKKRGKACLEIIKSYAPDMFCLQEVGRGQYKDFLKAFPDMASYGFISAVSDAHPRRFKQIRNVIFYSKARYEMTSCSEYALSETPYLPKSVFPGESLGRHVNWVRLRERKSGKEFRVMDTHLSLTSPTRIKETTLIASETSQYADDFPQIICGDFNSRLDSKEIGNMLNAKWRDSYHPADNSPRYMEARKIDFIFIRGPIETLATQYIEDDLNGVRPSDHRFVGADLKIGVS